jgi:hypothetical protein
MRWRGRARDRRSCRAYSFVTAACYGTLVGSEDVRSREIADRSDARGTVDLYVTRWVTDGRQRRRSVLATAR